MSNFDPARRLVMASFKTVLGHNLPRGTALTIAEEPKQPDEVDEAMARRLWNSRLAVYVEDLRPTPVETAEQRHSREAVETLQEAPEGATSDEITDIVSASTPADLVAWQVDDEGTGKKAGDRVTKDDLIVIAGREGVEIETDDNKPDLIRKIVEGRAALTAG